MDKNDTQPKYSGIKYFLDVEDHEIYLWVLVQVFKINGKEYFHILN